MTPMGWGDTLAGQPLLDRRIDGAVPTLVRRWRGIAPDIDQRALDHHYLSIHLGGAKRLHRDGEGQRLTRDAAPGAHSFVPAGAAYRWRTEGPIDFLHIYLNPKVVDRFMSICLEQNPRGAPLRDCLGISDVLVASLAAALSEELANADVQQAYLDDLMHLLLFRILRTQVGGPATCESLHALAPFKLRRALDFIEDQLAEPIGVADIAAAAGASTFHFSRGFRHAMALPPYAYLLERRVARAKQMLAASGAPLAEIARQCGFGGLSQFSRMFKRATGASPSKFRRRC